MAKQSFSVLTESFPIEILRESTLKRIHIASDFATYQSAQTPQVLPSEKHQVFIRPENPPSR
jgi:hypothetical protein